MSTGVSGNIRHVVVRQIDILRVAAKTELQNAHARKAKLFSQRNDVRSNYAEIFGNDRHLAECLANGCEQRPSRRFNPLATFGRLRSEERRVGKEWRSRSSR